MCNGIMYFGASLLYLVILALSVSENARAAVDAVPQFSSSIFLAGDWDYLPFNSTTNQSRCTGMVDRAAEYVANQVQFVPTFYWYDEGPLDPPPGFDPSCQQTNLSSYYCYNRFNATRVQHWCYSRLDGECEEVTESEMDSFVTHVGNCMKYAVSKGFNLAINARVDDGRSLGGWRNTLEFNPLQPYSKYSYTEAILFPLAEAVREAAGPTTLVDFEMQGEMGATAFFYPTQWVSVSRMVRNQILAGRPTSWDGNVKMGLGLNNNKLCGCINIGITDAREYLGNFSAAFISVQSEFDVAALDFLFGSMDFVGLSAYVPMTSPWFEVCDLEGLMERFDEEFAYYGLSLTQLSQQGVEIHWTEFGVGGGNTSSGNSKATTAEEAAYYPFWGVWGDYRCDTDPWMLCYPDQPSPVRDYSRYYYNQTAVYLQQGGCNYRVDAVYIWGVNSWDIQAIYPLSSTAQGSYQDLVIANIINLHNTIVADTISTVTDKISWPAGN